MKLCYPHESHKQVGDKEKKYIYIVDFNFVSLKTEYLFLLQFALDNTGIPKKNLKGYFEGIYF